MKKLLPFLCLSLIALCSSDLNADVIAFEDFEDATIGYTGPDNLSEVAVDDYYGRLAADTALPAADIAYGNMQGAGYYGVQDTDGVAAGPLDTITLNWAGIDTSMFTNLNLSWFVAEDEASDSAEDWDSTSEFRVDVDSGGGFVTIFQVASENTINFNDPVGGDQTNVRALVDTDFNGVGDGAEITDVFTQFSSNLADAASMDIRIVFTDLDSGDEDFAFDNLLLTGDLVAGVPEPTSALMFGAAIFGFCSRRRRG